MVDEVIDEPVFTTPPGGRKLYLSYLQTEALTQVIVNVEDWFVIYGKSSDRERRNLMNDIRHDALTELRGRQLELFKGPKPAPED
jgi:hypothetical protein